MDKITIKEVEETNGKRSISWRWPLATLAVVFLAVIAAFLIGFIFEDSNSFSYTHKESGKYKELQKHDKLKKPLQGYFRERPPTSYLVKFQSFTKMIERLKDGYYESRPFTVGGFNWTFIIYPNGNKKDFASGWVSVYARIDNSSLITDPQDVYAEIKFFAYNANNRYYYTHQELAAKRFHLSNTDWGVPLFLSTSLLPNSGFIFNGEQSVFGIDIFLAQPYKKWEDTSFNENVSKPVFNWNLTNFSTLNLDSYTSDLFPSGGRNWVLKVYPNGDGAGMANSLSLYLLSETNEKDYVQAKLRVLNEVPFNHVEKQVEGWPNAAENGWGFEKFIPLADLKDGTNLIHPLSLNQSK